MIDLEQQVACVERELKLRARAYPRWVAANRMSQAKADAEIAQMSAVLATLKQLAAPKQGGLFGAVTEREDSGDDVVGAPGEDAMIPIQQQVACVERELVLRARLRSASGGDATADAEIVQMRAVLSTLKTLAELFGVVPEPEKTR